MEKASGNAAVPATIVAIIAETGTVLRGPARAENAVIYRAVTVGVTAGNAAITIMTSTPLQ